MGVLGVPNGIGVETVMKPGAKTSTQEMVEEEEEEERERRVTNLGYRFLASFSEQLSA